MKADSKKYISAILMNPVVLLALVIVTGVIWLLFQKISLLKSGKGRVAICTVVKNTGSIAYEFYVDGKKHFSADGTKNQAPYFQIGEHYEVLYNPQDPGVWINYWEYPHIDDTVQTALTAVHQIEEVGGMWPVKFSYLVNGQSYTRLQLFPDDITFDPDKKYQVTYFVHRPEIGYLLFPESKHPYAIRF